MNKKLSDYNDSFKMVEVKNNPDFEVKKYEDVVYSPEEITENRMIEMGKNSSVEAMRELLKLI